VAEMQDKNADAPLLEVRDLQIGATAYPPGEKPRPIEIVKGVSFTLESGSDWRIRSW